MVKPKRKLKIKKKTIIIAVILSFLVILTGFGISGYFYVSRRIKGLIVTDIHIDEDVIVKTKINFTVSAYYWHSFPESDARALKFARRGARELYIWAVVDINPRSGNFPALHHINLSIEYTFPTTGTWWLIGRNYTTSITVTDSS